jgi:hypothetical protein
MHGLVKIDRVNVFFMVVRWDFGISILRAIRRLYG